MFAVSKKTRPHKHWPWNFCFHLSPKLIDLKRLTAGRVTSLSSEWNLWTRDEKNLPKLKEETFFGLRCAFAKWRALSYTTSGGRQRSQSPVSRKRQTWHRSSMLVLLVGIEPLQLSVWCRFLWARFQVWRLKRRDLWKQPGGQGLGELSDSIHSPQSAGFEDRRYVTMFAKKDR